MIALTVTELTTSALAELDHPENTAALPLWKEKLLRSTGLGALEEGLISS